MMCLVQPVHGQCGACSFLCFCHSILCTVPNWCILCICSEGEFQRKDFRNHHSETLVAHSLQKIEMDKYFIINYLHYDHCLKENQCAILLSKLLYFMALES